MKPIFILLAVWGGGYDAAGNLQGWAWFERVGTFPTMSKCVAAAKLLDKQPYMARSFGKTTMYTDERSGPNYRCTAAFE